MLSFHRLAALAALFVMFPLATAPAASSRHARIEGGVGNVVIGEALPYQKDSGWKNHKASGQTLKLSELKTWAAFDARAFFDAPIAKIKGFEEDRSTLVWFMVVQPKGGKARVFADRLMREKAPAPYLGRDSWATYTKALHFNDARRGWGGVYVQRRPALDHSDPGTFLYEHGEILFEKGKRLNTVWLSEILAKHGSATVTAFVKVFRYEGSGHRKVGGGDYVVDTDTSGRLEVKERFGIAEAWRFDEGRLIARGSFKLVP